MSLILPATLRPTNLHLRDETQAKVVDSDLFDICRRIQELDERLFILELDGSDRHVFAIMERCRDGVDRLVYKVNQLDGRVVQKLRWLMAQPLDQRMKQLEEEEHRLEREAREEEMDDFYERMGRPMWTELERTGFVQRGVSYAKRGVAQPGKHG